MALLPMFAVGSKCVPVSALAPSVPACHLSPSDKRLFDLARGDAAMSYLRMALLQERVGDRRMARVVFQKGVACYRHDATLMVAWALFEYRHGNQKAAKRLLCRACERDASKHAVLRWRIFEGE